MNRAGLAILGVVMAGVLSGCASRSGGIMEMRLAEIDDIPGLLEYMNPEGQDPDDKIYVSETIIASDKDVERAGAIRMDDDTYAVAVTLTESAARRILRVWSRDLRGRLAVFIEGRPVCSLPMWGKFDRHIVITGRFNRRYAESLAERLNPGEGQSVRTDTLDESLPTIPRRIDFRKNLRWFD